MTRRDLALQLLEEAGERGVTTAQFLQAGVGSRYGARIMELRQEGYQIESERLRDSSWRYTLRAGSPNSAAPPAAPAGVRSRGVASPAAASAGPGTLWIADYRGPVPIHTNPPLEAA